jgi:hypothetical protein
LSKLALAEMWRRSEELGEDPRAIEQPKTVAHTTVQSAGLVIEPVDWDEEHREHLERERQARIEEATRLLETSEPPERPTAPAPKRPAA